MTTVDVGGVTFTNDPAGEIDGALWLLSGIDGWHDGPPVKGQATDRPAAHGVFAERVYRGARLVSLVGSVLCPTRAVASSAQRTLSALLADGRLADLTVTDPDQGALTATVRLATNPVIDWDRSSTVVDFDLRFLAPDPLLYGEVVSAPTAFPVQAGGLEYDLYTDGAGTDLGYLEFGDLGATGQATLTNVGTADSWPQFEVRGPVAPEGFEIVRGDTGQRLVFEGSVPAGSVLVLDAASGAVVIDGAADRSSLLTHRDWWAVPAGGSVLFAFVPRGATSAASVTATLRPAFW